MTPLAFLLIGAGAVVMFALGALHLLYTFSGTKLHPRHAELRARLEQAPLVLTRETSMWRAWVGFNASHSVGALLFGAVYGYLALMQGGFLFQSWFLLGLGLVVLAAYALLARRYWFSLPFQGILLALALYASALLVTAASALQRS